MSELTDKRTVIARLRALGVEPTKRRGQNFLVNRDVLAQIIAEVNHAAPQVIIEIGPGLGTVTRELARLGAQVIAVEIDHRLAAGLRADLGKYDNVNIVETDFLVFDPTAVGNGPYYVVGNLPYRITSPILTKLVAHRRLITHALLITQAEVADKVTASPGVDGSALGVLATAYAETTVMRRIPRTAFYPVPEVDSVLWRLKFLPQPRFTANEHEFFTVVRTVYGKRRKMLRRALRDIVPPDRAAAALARTGIDPTRRGETLSFAELDRLTHALFDQLGQCPPD